MKSYVDVWREVSRIINVGSIPGFKAERDVCYTDQGPLREHR
jgi:hypothetical protein